MFNKLKPVTYLILLLIGAASSLLFWWSIAGIIIGSAFYLFHPQRNWKQHGLTLAYVASIATVIVENAEERGKILAITSGLIAMIAYFIIVVLIALIRKIRSGGTRDFGSAHFLFPVWKNSSSIVKARVILLLLIPLVLWGQVSLNFQVLFDNSTRGLWINAPSVVETGEPFTVTVQSWDQFQRVSATFQGTVSFSLIGFDPETLTSLSPVTEPVPSPYTFTGRKLGSPTAYALQNGNDNGMQQFTFNFSTPGFYYILAKDTETDNEYYSNPVWAQSKEQMLEGKRIYWGDIHSHTFLSDGSGTLKHSLQYAREVALLDFFSPTEHGEHLNLFGLDKDFKLGLTRFIERAINLANQEHSFVVFQGMEWTNPYIGSGPYPHGHYTIISSGDALPLVANSKQQSAGDLWAYLDAYTEANRAQVIALPHHTVRNSFIQDWMYYNEKYVRIAEVTSVHGESLFNPDDPNSMGTIDIPVYPLPGSSINDALKMGFRIGLAASSDGHDGRPGRTLSHTPAYIGHQLPFTTWHARNNHPYTGGLTAVFADNLTRPEIFNALYERQVYASSDHGRPILSFSINNTTVGGNSTVTVANGESRAINILLAQDGSYAFGNPANPNSPIEHQSWNPDWQARIQVFKNGLLWESVNVLTPVVNITLHDTAPVTGTSYSEFYERNGQYYINKESDVPLDLMQKLALNTGKKDFYYVRVVQLSGRVSYIGPIWVEAGQ